MKKTLLGIAGILAVVSSANASDTERIKAACQASDKMLWVENNQVCIPKNPCKNEKFEAYCNRDFKDVETQGIGYQVIIEAFARTHNLSCRPIPTNAKLIGDDYVTCMGDDVMVFQFDDIHDHNITDNISGEYMLKQYPILCNAIDGQELVTDRNRCYKTNNAKCSTLNDILKEYDFGWATWVTWDEDLGEHCFIHSLQEQYGSGDIVERIEQRKEGLLKSF